MMRSYKDKNVRYKGYDEKERYDQMTEIIAHFICNLCGSGHHWLRRWCLDHFDFISNVKKYNYDELDKVAIQVVFPNGEVAEEKSPKTLSIEEFIYSGSHSKSSKYMPRVAKDSFGSSESPPLIVRSFGEEWRDSDKKENNPYVLLNCVFMECVNDFSYIQLKYHYNPNDIMKRIMRLFVSAKYVFMHDKSIYDPFNNIGITHLFKKNWYGKYSPITETSEMSLFNLHNVSYDDELEFEIATMYFNGVNSLDCKKFVAHNHSYWYYSEKDPTCEWQNKINFSRTYLTMYGSIPNVSGMFEIFARHYLNVIKDEKKVHRGDSIGGEYINSDSYNGYASD
jgi:hypothetical protein